MDKKSQKNKKKNKKIKGYDKSYGNNGEGVHGNDIKGAVDVACIVYHRSEKQHRDSIDVPCASP